jgi:hypothetical protein
MSLKMGEGEIRYFPEASQTKVKRYHGYKAGRYMLPNDEVILLFLTFRAHRMCID